VRLTKLIASIKSELPVTPRHEAWLADNPNATYTDEAKSFLAEEVGKPQRDRSAAFSASGATICPRRRLFSYLGVPEGTKFNTRTIQIFHNGTFMHLRWQLAGISAGWLATPEAFATHEGLRVKGSLDGILDTGEGLELKSINSNGFNWVMSAQAPKLAHQGQIGTYFVMLPEIDAFSVIYENKDTQDYKEFLIKREKGPVTAARIELEVLNEHVDHRKLPEIKDACWAKQGSEYLQCPFREICPTIKVWEQAEELASTGSRSSG
jgi:hypothetical protein